MSLQSCCLAKRWSNPLHYCYSHKETYAARVISRQKGAESNCWVCNEEKPLGLNNPPEHPSDALKSWSWLKISSINSKVHIIFEKEFQRTRKPYVKCKGCVRKNMEHFWQLTSSAWFLFMICCPMGVSTVLWVPAREETVDAISSCSSAGPAEWFTEGSQIILLYY
jgi:hypothetical protein